MSVLSNKELKEQKSELRRGLKSKRSELDENSRLNLDSEIQSRFLALRQYALCDTVFTYVSKDTEVDTTAVIRAAWANGKKVAVPKCVDNNELEFYYIESMDDLEEGFCGLKEPVEGKCQKVGDYSKGICIVPGLSFDAEGYRLGYGKGYYDRFLVKFGGVTVGFCYSSCIKWKLPRDQYDRAVDIIITDRYVRNTGGKPYYNL
ncbi:MAG: 5-formyltetrahydrofolate cyclo-ligase [Clostridia bacterium]|nr:5-formyltetrahydrofolate cyclo-ligase [Clostridia bacterium]